MESTWGTSSTLLERVRNQEAGAWEMLCRIYTPLVYGWARRAKLNEPDAEDVVQEVFQRISSNLHKFRHERAEDTFRGWMWTIARNQIRDWYRRKQTRPPNAEGGSHAHAMLHAVPDWINDEGEEPESDPASEAALVRRALELVKGDFGESTWKAFWRLAIEGQPTKDIAADLEISENSVRQAKFRVLTRLKEVLG